MTFSGDMIQVLKIMLIVCCGLLTWPQGSHAQDMAAYELLKTDLMNYGSTLNLQLAETSLSNGDTIEFAMIEYEYLSDIQVGKVLYLPDVNNGFNINAGFPASFEQFQRRGWQPIFVGSPTLDLALLQSSTFLPQNSSSNEEPEQQTNASDTELAASEELAMAAELVDSTKDYLLNSLVTSLEKYAEEPGFRLVIAEGMSGFLVHELLADGELDGVDGFVMLNPYIPDTERNARINQTVAQTNIPVLDLVNINSNRWSRLTADRRKLNARAQTNTLYRQSELLGMGIAAEEYQFATGLIIGWTYYLGW